MLDRPEVEPEVRSLYDGLDRSVRGGEVPLRRFKDELTAVWFDAGGFEHVFCGEPRADELGGLHYRGRYLDLQEQGMAGLMTGRRVPRHRGRAAGLHRRRALPAARRRPTPDRLPQGLRLRPGCRATCCSPPPQAYRELRRQRGAEMCLEEIAVAGRRCLLRGGRGPRRRDPHLLPGPLARLRRRRAPGELRLRRVG